MSAQGVRWSKYAINANVAVGGARDMVVILLWNIYIYAGGGGGGVVGQEREMGWTDDGALRSSDSSSGVNVVDERPGPSESVSMPKIRR